MATIPIASGYEIDGSTLSIDSGNIITFNLANANTWTGVWTFTKPIQTSQGGSITNTALGTSALGTNTSLYNTAIGNASLASNITGQGNTAVGTSSLGSNNSGTGNCAFGYESLGHLVSGNQNCAFGIDSGNNYSSSETSNIIIGNGVLGTAGESYVTRIGNSYMRNDLIRGNGIVADYANASDFELTTTAATTVATFTPFAQGNFMVTAYFRVITAATTVTLTATWSDSSGAQTYTWVNAVSEPVGSYTQLPIYVNATASAITITATAGTANQVYVSANIVSMT